METLKKLIDDVQKTDTWSNSFLKSTKELLKKNNLLHLLAMPPATIMPLLGLAGIKITNPVRVIAFVNKLRANI